jgi:hypothetical protein
VENLDFASLRLESVDFADDDITDFWHPGAVDWGIDCNRSVDDFDLTDSCSDYSPIDLNHTVADITAADFPTRGDELAFTRC